MVDLQFFAEVVMSAILSPKALLMLGKFGTKEWEHDFARVRGARNRR
jgi:hypothetical protein